VENQAKGEKLAKSTPEQIEQKTRRRHRGEELGMVTILFGPSWYFDTCHSTTTVIWAYNEYEQHTEGHSAAQEKSFKVLLGSTLFFGIFVLVTCGAK